MGNENLDKARVQTRRKQKNLSFKLQPSLTHPPSAPPGRQQDGATTRTMCQPRGDPKCLRRERSQKPPICPFNRQTPQPRAEEGRKGSSQPLPSTASGHRQAWALSKLRCPKHLPSCSARCAAGHLGTPLVPTQPPREEQETASLTLSPLPLPATARASAAAVEGRWLSSSSPSGG